MVKKSNNWNLQEMQETLVKDTEQRIEQGFEEIKNESGDALAVTPAAEQQSTEKPSEPTKGVQTYIHMSDYLRLNTIKCHRGETIGNLVAQAIELWLDVQEGKAKVSATI